MPKPGKYTVTCERDVGVIRPGQSAYTVVAGMGGIVPTLPIATTFDITIEDNPSAEASFIAGLAPMLTASPESSYSASSVYTYLAQDRSPAAFPAIVKLLDTNGVVQDDIMRQLPTNYGGNLNVAIQDRAVYWLTFYGSDMASGVLLSRAPKLAPIARASALTALADWNTPGTVPLILASLRSSSTPLRRAAVKCSSLKVFPGTMPMLSTMTGDLDPDVRQYLAIALGISRDKAAIPALLKLLRDTASDPPVKIFAAEGLGKLGRTDGVPVLINMLRGPQTEYHDMICSALDKLTGKHVGGNARVWLQWWNGGGKKEFEKHRSVQITPPNL